MTSSVSTLASWLGRFEAFRDLSADELDWLAHRAEPFQCGVGQELLSKERLPEYCYAVVEGRGRVLHDDPGLRRPVTLAYSNPGDLVGWAGLASRRPCEWITAAQSLKLTGIVPRISCFQTTFKRFLRLVDRSTRRRADGCFGASIAPAQRLSPGTRCVLPTVARGRRSCFPSYAGIA